MRGPDRDLIEMKIKIVSFGIVTAQLHASFLTVRMTIRKLFMHSYSDGVLLYFVTVATSEIYGTDTKNNRSFPS